MQESKTLPFEPITAPNLSDAAANQIRKLIAADVLRPGDALPGERDLAARMNISRTSLRGALQTLVAEGLLKSKQGAGLWVSSDLGRSITDPLVALIETSPKAVTDYLHFRIMLESDCAATVAAHATPAERARIDEIHIQMQSATAAGHVDRGMELDTEFHMAIVEATGNVVTIQVTRSLHHLLQRTVRENHAAAYRSPTDAQVLNDHHSQINEAIQNGQPEAARNAMRTHLEYFEDILRRSGDAAERAHLVEQRKSWASQR